MVKKMKLRFYVLHISKKVKKNNFSFVPQNPVSDLPTDSLAEEQNYMTAKKIQITCECKYPC